MPIQVQVVSDSEQARKDLQLLKDAISQIKNVAANFSFNPFSSSASASTTNAAKQLNAINASAKQASDSFKQFNTSTGVAATQLEAVNGKYVKIKQSTDNVVNNQIKFTKTIGDSGKQVTLLQDTITKAADQFKSLAVVAASSVAALASVSSYMSATDSITAMTSKLRIATASQGEFNQALIETRNISMNTRTGLLEVTDLYAKLSQSTQTFAREQADVARVSEIVSKAVALSGSTAEMSAAAVMQLGQAFSSGVLQGDELRSISENAMVLMQTIANGFGKTIGQVRQMGSEGKLTSESLFKALMSQGNKVDEQFTKLGTTFAQATTKLKSSGLILFSELTKVFSGTSGATGQASADQGIPGYMSKIADGITRFAEDIRFNITRLKIEAFILLMEVESFFRKPLSLQFSIAKIKAEDILPSQAEFVEFFSGIANGIQAGLKSLFSSNSSNAAPVQKRATGGPIHGKGSGTSDEILLLGSNGEFMINAKAYSQNKALVEAINNGTKLPRYATGGPIGSSNTTENTVFGMGSGSAFAGIIAIVSYAFGGIGKVISAVLGVSVLISALIPDISKSISSFFDSVTSAMEAKGSNSTLIETITGAVINGFKIAFSFFDRAFNFVFEGLAKGFGGIGGAVGKAADKLAIAFPSFEKAIGTFKSIMRIGPYTGGGPQEKASPDQRPIIHDLLNTFVPLKAQIPLMGVVTALAGGAIIAMTSTGAIRTSLLSLLTTGFMMAVGLNVHKEETHRVMGSISESFLGVVKSVTDVLFGSGIFGEKGFGGTLMLIAKLSLLFSAGREFVSKNLINLATAPTTAANALSTAFQARYANKQTDKSTAKLEEIQKQAERTKAASVDAIKELSSLSMGRNKIGESIAKDLANSRVTANQVVHPTGFSNNFNTNQARFNGASPQDILHFQRLAEAARIATADFNKLETTQKAQIKALSESTAKLKGYSDELSKRVSNGAAELKTNTINAAAGIGGIFGSLAGWNIGNNIAKGMTNSTEWERVAVIMASAMLGQTVVAGFLSMFTAGLLGVAGAFATAFTGLLLSQLTLAFGPLMATAGVTLSLPIVAAVVGIAAAFTVWAKFDWFAEQFTKWSNLGKTWAADFLGIPKDRVTKFKDKDDAEVWANNNTERLNKTDKRDPNYAAYKDSETLARLQLLEKNAINNAAKQEDRNKIGLPFFVGGTLQLDTGDVSDFNKERKKLEDSYKGDKKSGAFINTTEALDKAAIALQKAAEDSEKQAGTIPSAISSFFKAIGARASKQSEANAVSQNGLFAYATGGHITGRGSGTSDQIPAMLSNGEFVINAEATQKNRGLLEKINSNKAVRHFAEGGYITDRMAKEYPEKKPFRDEDGEHSFYYRKIPHGLSKDGISALYADIDARAIKEKMPIGKRANGRWMNVSGSNGYADIVPGYAEIAAELNGFWANSWLVKKTVLGKLDEYIPRFSNAGTHVTLKDIEEGRPDEQTADNKKPIKRASGGIVGVGAGRGLINPIRTDSNLLRIPEIEQQIQEEISTLSSKASAKNIWSSKGLRKKLLESADNAFFSSESGEVYLPRLSALSQEYIPRGYALSLHELGHANQFISDAGSGDFKSELLKDSEKYSKGTIVEEAKASFWALSNNKYPDWDATIRATLASALRSYHQASILKNKPEKLPERIRNFLKTANPKESSVLYRDLEIGTPVDPKDPISVMADSSQSNAAGMLEAAYEAFAKLGIPRKNVDTWLGFPKPLLKASGGHIRGKGTGTSDEIPAMLSNGEFVINAAATSKNRDLLEKINSNKTVSDAGSFDVSQLPLDWKANSTDYFAGKMSEHTGLPKRPVIRNFIAYMRANGGYAASLRKLKNAAIGPNPTKEADDAFEAAKSKLIQEEISAIVSRMALSAALFFSGNPLTKGAGTLLSLDALASMLQGVSRGARLNGAYSDLPQHTQGIIGVLERIPAGASVEPVMNQVLSVRDSFKIPNPFDDYPLKKAFGGHIRGKGTGTSDEIPAMLSNGEFVINAAATGKNRDLLEKINSNKTVRHFATGGYVSTAINKDASIPAEYTDVFSKLVLAIRGIENASGDPNAVSHKGAAGAMQITRDTFNTYKKAGEVFENESDRVSAAMRKLTDDFVALGYDVKLTAAAYHAGRGVIQRDMTINPKSNDKDAAGKNGMFTTEYADRIATRVNSTGVLSPWRGRTNQVATKNVHDNWNDLPFGSGEHLKKIDFKSIPGGDYLERMLDWFAEMLRDKSKTISKELDPLGPSFKAAVAKINGMQSPLNKRYTEATMRGLTAEELTELRRAVRAIEAPRSPANEFEEKTDSDELKAAQATITRLVNKGSSSSLEESMRGKSDIEGLSLLNDELRKGKQDTLTLSEYAKLPSADMSRLISVIDEANKFEASRKELGDFDRLKADKIAAENWQHARDVIERARTAPGGTNAPKYTVNAGKYATAFVTQFESDFAGGFSQALKGQIKVGAFGKMLLDKFTAGIVDGFAKGFTDTLFKGLDIQGFLTKWMTKAFTQGEDSGGATASAANTQYNKLFPEPTNWNDRRNPVGPADVLGFGPGKTGPDGALPDLKVDVKPLDAVMNESAIDFESILTNFGKGFEGVLKNLSGLFGGGGGGGSSGSLLGGFGKIFTSIGSLFGGGLKTGLEGISPDVMSLVGLASGGMVYGAGTGTSDSIPAMLSHGEFVVNAASTKKYGKILSSINSGKVPHFAEGGFVTLIPSVAESTKAIEGGSSKRSSSVSSQATFNINVTGDISRQTKREIISMLPDISRGVNSYNREANIK